MRNLWVLVCLIGFTVVSGAEPRANNYQHLISAFWKLDSKSQKILSRVSKWSDVYETDNVISAASSQELKDAMVDIYRLVDAIRELQRKTSKGTTGFFQSRKFSDLYEEEDDRLDEDLVQLLIETLADLVLYEQMSFFYHITYEDKTLIKRLNEIEVLGQKNHFKRLQTAWMSPLNRKKFAKSLRILEKKTADLDLLQNDGDLFLIALRDRLYSTVADEIRKSESFWTRVGSYFKWNFRRLRQRARTRLNWMEYHLSKVFGNAAGAVNIQKLLDSIPEKELRRVRTGVLQPGDIIVEKTAGAITDKFIPGHFGHVAVVAGTPEQLKGLTLKNGTPLLETPLVFSLLDRLEAGETVVEAIRPGTTLINIEHWTITDLAVLRPRNYTKEELGQVIYDALAYVGTDYDFNFDVNTRSIVVCSELPYQSFAKINFRIAKSAGRYTISPDDVAVLAGPAGKNAPNRPLDLVYFNHETKEVPAEGSFELYKELLEKEESRYDDVPSNP